LKNCQSGQTGWQFFFIFIRQKFLSSHPKNEPQNYCQKEEKNKQQRRFLTFRFNIMLEEFSTKNFFVGNYAKMNDFATY